MQHIVLLAATAEFYIPLTLEIESNDMLYEKTCLRSFRPGSTQTELYKERIWLEARHVGFRKNRDFTYYIVKTKALLIFAFVLNLPRAGVFMSRLISLRNRLNILTSPVNPQQQNLHK